MYHSFHSILNLPYYHVMNSTHSKIHRDEYLVEVYYPLYPKLHFLKLDRISKKKFFNQLRLDVQVKIYSYKTINFLTKGCH